MKKFLFFLILMTGFVNVFAQLSPLDKKLKIKELPPDFFLKLSRVVAPDLNCRCGNNLLRDGSFATVTGSAYSISAASPIWKPGGGSSPQHSKTQGACDSGFVSMWGNKSVGEYIYQSGLSLKQGKCYTIKFNARRLQTNTSTNNPYVQLGVVPSSAANPGDPFTGNTPAIVSGQIVGTAWASYTITFTAATAFSTLSFFPVNGNAQQDGNFVSWIQLDNVCIEECCDCGDWRGFAFALYPKESKEEAVLPSDKGGKIITCGKGIVVNAGNVLKLNPVFYCSGSACTATYKGTLTLPNGAVQDISNFPYSFSQTQPGAYTISVTPYCDGKVCKPCVIRVFVTPGCNGDILPEVKAGDGRG